jgi:hypothetical protein
MVRSATTDATHPSASRYQCDLKAGYAQVIDVIAWCRTETCYTCRLKSMLYRWANRLRSGKPQILWQNPPGTAIAALAARDTAKGKTGNRDLGLAEPCPAR